METDRIELTDEDLRVDLPSLLALCECQVRYGRDWLPARFDLPRLVASLCRLALAAQAGQAAAQARARAAGAERDELRRRLGLAFERISQQSELLTRRAEKGGGA